MFLFIRSRLDVLGTGVMVNAQQPALVFYIYQLRIWLKVSLGLWQDRNQDTNQNFSCLEKTNIGLFFFVVLAVNSFLWNWNALEHLNGTLEITVRVNHPPLQDLYNPGDIFLT